MDLATTNISVTGEKRDWAFESVFGRFNYSFKNKYLFQVNARSDGSSRLPEKNRYHVLYSFSGGWFLSRENFFSKLPFSKQINNLKFRVAHGQAGNDPLGNQPFTQSMDSHNYYYFADELIPGTTVNQLSNEDINWVITTASNLGVDLQMFKNSLNITIDLYNKTTDNVVWSTTLAPSYGYPGDYLSNMVSASNKGIEWDIQYRNNANKVEFFVGLNGAYNKNQVASASGEAMITQPFIMVGRQPFNSYYGFVYEGIVKDSSELNAPALTGKSLQLGSMKFKDLNGDSIINDQDRTVIGSSNIPYELGLTGGITYRGFDMNFLFQAVLGKKIYLKDWGNRPVYSETNTFWEEWWYNRYDPVNNPDGTWPAIRQNAVGVEEVSTFWLHDASYLRLKNIEIGYSLPNPMVKKLYLTGVRFYVAGQNLFTFSPLIKQVDPERGARTTKNSIYPQIKLITAGVNISL
jgi:TonB-linked SusC/RagA family outer membrane protein